MSESIEFEFPECPHCFDGWWCRECVREIVSQMENIAITGERNLIAKAIDFNNSPGEGVWTNFAEEIRTGTNWYYARLAIQNKRKTVKQ